MKNDQVAQIAKEYEQQNHNVLVCDDDGHIIYQSKTIPNQSAPFVTAIMHASNALVKNSNGLSISLYCDQNIHIAKRSGYIFALYEKK